MFTESLLIGSIEYIRKYSCHLRAFRAVADVANYGKSVVVPKVAIFGNFWEASKVLPIYIPSLFE